MATGLLEALGLKQIDTTSPPGGGSDGSAADASAADADFSPVPAPRDLSFLNPNSPQMRAMLMKGLDEQAARDRKDAEQTLVRMNKALRDVQAYVAGLPGDALSKAGYAQVMTDVRQRFPEAASLSQWVRETAIKVPALRGKLPAPQALAATVESAVHARGAQHGWALSTGKNLGTLNSDRLLAAYMSELPAGVTVNIAGGVVQLSLAGAALAVATPAGAVDATAGKGGAAISLKNDDLAIRVENEGWKEFDPQLRARWQKIGSGASAVLRLEADRDQARLALEQKKKGGAEVVASLTADFEKKQAAFELAWKKLQEKIDVTAKASEKSIGASVAWLKKAGNDEVAARAGAEVQIDLETLQGKLNAYYRTPTVEAAIEVTAAADRVAAKLELTAVRSGVVVTASFERALDETQAAIEVMLRDGKTTIAAELKQKADELTAKVRLVHDHKDLKLAAELEKTLKDVRGRIEVEYRKGATTVTGGASASSGGEVGAKVQIDVALQNGRTFVGEGDKLSFTANVSNQGYRFEVAFSMGEPVETASLQDLFKDADTQIRELYKLAGDQGVRSIADAQALNARMQEVMKPVKDAAGKAKTLKKKSEIAASFGFSIEGEWPAGGKASAPAAMFSVTLAF